MSALLFPAAAEVYAAMTMPSITASSARANVIVVLGGETVNRVSEAARLFVEGRADTVLVSGAGDCALNRAHLIAGGVPADRILLDCTSESTWENAHHARPIFRKLNARRAIIVTSWFHVPRALTCFDEVNPEMEFLAAPVYPAGEGLGDVDGWRRLGTEYVKTAWYFARYGVPPLGFPRLDGDGRADGTTPPAERGP